MGRNTIYWQAGLSNGETATEGKGAYSETTGELSPYQCLLSYCREHNLTITSLSLCHADGRRWNLPSAGANPRFKAFADAPKPNQYRFFRRVAAEAPMGGAFVKTDTFAIIEALYPDTKLQVWVDDKGTSWSLII